MHKLIKQAIFIVLTASLLIAGFSSSAMASPNRQEGGSLMLDGSASPQVVQAGDTVHVNLTIMGDLESCNPTETRVPLDVALVVDISGSMGDSLGDSNFTSKFNGALEAIDAFIQQIDPVQDRVGLVGFSDGGKIYASLGTGDEVLAQFDELRADLQGGTDIGAGLAKAQNLFNDSRSGAAQVVIVLTDGLDQGNNTISESDQLKSDDIRLVTIGLGYDVDETFLRSLASDVSDYYFSPDVQSLQEIFESIARNIQTYSPASDIEVRFVYDVLNFDLVEDSITPEPDEVSIDVITWRFPEMTEMEKSLSLDFVARVPGVFDSALESQISYISCGEDVRESQMNAMLPVTVESGSINDPVCVVTDETGFSFLGFICGFPYWGPLLGLILGLIFLALWLKKNRSALRAKRCCGIRPPKCMWIKLLLLLWLAVFIGALASTLINTACAPKEGILFWRILPDRSSAVFVKSNVPDLPAKPLTDVFPEQEWMGFYAVSEESQRIAAVSRGTNGLIVGFDLAGNSIDFPQIQGAYPAWSPDGTKLAYSANNEDIYIYDFSTDSVAALEGASDPDVVESMPAWNATGDTITFVRSIGTIVDDEITTPTDIMTVPASGGIPQQVPGASGQGFNYYPAFSPDGQWLAFTFHLDGKKASWVPEAEIRVVPAAGGTARKIQANYGPGGQDLPDGGNIWPTWSKDSQTIYFSSRRCEDQYDIYSATIGDAGASSPAERRSDLDELDSYEYKAVEVSFTSNPLLQNLINLWPFLVPLPFLLLLLWLFCRSKREAELADTVGMNIDVAPKNGVNLPTQEFKVNLEVFGKPTCEKRVVQNPVDAVILIDNSGSMEIRDMGGKSRLEAAKSAAEKFIKCVLSGNDRIAVASFSDDAEVHIGFGNDEGNLVQAINKIRPAGGTNMDRGLRAVGDLFESSSRENVTKSVILLSDGEPFDVEATIAEAERLKENGIKIMAIGVGEAQERLLQVLSEGNGAYRFVQDKQGLAETFIDFGKILITPIPASDVYIKHSINSEAFQLNPNSVMPRPDEISNSVIVWKIPELYESPRYFSYAVSPKADGNLYIDHQTEISYCRCESRSTRTMMVEAGALVDVDESNMPIIENERILLKEFDYKRPDIVWQPDKALFIGVGHYGRKLLTYVRKNLLDAGVGNLPEGCEFLIFDTGGYDVIEGMGNPVAFAGVEIPDNDVFMVDENLNELINDWSSGKREMPDYLKDWFNPKLWVGSGQEMNLATGRYSHRALSRVALLRLLMDEGDIASQWRAKDPEHNRDLRSWILERCHKAKKDNGDLRIFIVGSVADGMSGTLLDLALLTRELAKKNVVEPHNDIHIEAYLLDALTVAATIADTDIKDMYLANAYATQREIDRWQMVIGPGLSVPWQSDEITYAPFDELFYYPKGVESDLFVQAFPVISDLITSRLDRATGAGTTGDWFNDMHQLRTKRRQDIHKNVVGCVNAYCMRVPVSDILNAINARWADEIVRTFFFGGFESEMVFDLSLAGDPGLPADPKYLLGSFLFGGGGFGGEAPKESMLLGQAALGMDASQGVSIKNSIEAEKSDETIGTEFKERLIKAIQHILNGTESYSYGARAGKLAYLEAFLKNFAEKMSSLMTSESDERIRHIAEIYNRVLNYYYSDLLSFKNSLYQVQSDQPLGLIQRLQEDSSDYLNVQSELNRIQSRKYFWGEKNKPSYDQEWYGRYLADTINDHQDLLGWVINDRGIDLCLRIAGQKVSLRADGVDTFINHLTSYAMGLSKDAWQNVSLVNILDSYDLLYDRSYGEEIRQKADIATHLLFNNVDTGMNAGKMMMAAPKPIQEALEYSDFVTGLNHLPNNVDIVFGEITPLNSTDKYAISFLRIMDAIRADRLKSVVESEPRYMAQEMASVFVEEVQANEIERMEEFPDVDGELLHAILSMCLTNIDRAEIFCLAAAEGFLRNVSASEIQFDSRGNGPEPIQLSSHEYPRMDLGVNALLNWVRDPKNEFGPWREFLMKRYSSRNQLNEELLYKWSEWQVKPNRTWTTEDNPENKSLRILITTFVRLFLKSPNRTWEA